MTEGRNFGGACYSSVERCVYMVGGCLTEESSSVEKLDLKTGLWKKLANTKTKRDSPGVISDQLGNIYAIGKPVTWVVSRENDQFFWYLFQVTVRIGTMMSVA